MGGGRSSLRIAGLLLCTVVLTTTAGPKGHYVPKKDLERKLEWFVDSFCREYRYSHGFPGRRHGGHYGGFGAYRRRPCFKGYDYKYKFYTLDHKDLQPDQDRHGYKGGFDNEDFYVAFIAHAQNTRSVYKKYTWDGHDDDRRRPYQCACLPKSSDKYYGQRERCRHHYKSVIIQDWKRFPIDKVRVSVFRGGKEVVYFLFRGNDSSATDFFHKDRLVGSSYGSLKSYDFNFFSVAGDHERRFFINNAYANNCPGDKGWLAVVDGVAGGKDYCRWTDYKHYPVFLCADYYSHPQVWNSLDKDVVQQTDAFIISVSFKRGCTLDSIPLPDCKK